MAEQSSIGKPTIVVSANNGWNVVNYRQGLVRALQAEGFNVAVLAPDGPYSSRIEELGVDFYAVPMSPRGTSPLEDLWALTSFVRRLRAIRPAAFLGFTAKPNIYGSLAAQLWGIPAVNNISGLGTVFARRSSLTRLVTTLYKLALRRSATVFFQNPDDLALFKLIGLVDPRRAALLPGSGVDLAHFSPGARKVPGEPFTFLFAARLLWDKGVGQYVESARRLRSSNLRFQILGILEPPSAAAVPPDKIRGWEGEGIIEFLGAADDVRPHFRNADCVVLPSYYPEGVPRVLLEASAMAITVITTNTPGCREAVDDNVTGFLCEPRSVDSLAAAMERMSRIPQENWVRMGAAARRKMELHFSEGIVHRAYADVLRNLGVSPGQAGRAGSDRLTSASA